jgi:hypothetical protein
LLASPSTALSTSAKGASKVRLAPQSSKFSLLAKTFVLLSACHVVRASKEHKYAYYELFFTLLDNFSAEHVSGADAATKTPTAADGVVGQSRLAEHRVAFEKLKNEVESPFVLKWGGMLGAEAGKSPANEEEAQEDSDE